MQCEQLTPSWNDMTKNEQCNSPAVCVMGRPGAVSTDHTHSLCWIHAVAYLGWLKDIYKDSEN